MKCISWETIDRLTKDPFSAANIPCQLPLIETLVPLIVGFVCVIIVLLFAGAFLGLVCESIKFRGTFSNLSRRLAKIRSRDEPMDDQKLHSVGEILKDNPSTKHGWYEFSETLVHEPNGVLNTRPAQDFFPEHEIVEARIHLGFFDAVPALLTGLGLFATFLALYLGLGGLRVPEGTGQIEGIPEFIQALSGKFLSSVLGLLAAVLFTGFKAVLVPWANHAYRRFCETFDSLFDRIMPEDLLRRINNQISEQSATLKHLATDLSDRFKEGMNENLKPPLERMIDLMQRSLEERTQTFEEMASKLADTFHSNFAQTTNFEFNQVTDALERTLAMVGRMEERSAESQRGFSDLIERLGRSTAELSGRLDSAASNLGMTQSAARDALDKTVRQILTASAQQTEQNTRQVQEAILSLQSSMGEVLENLRQAAGGLQQGGIEAQSKLLAAAEVLSSRISDGATEATEALAGTAKEVVDHNAEQSAKISQRLEALLDREENRSELITQQREAQRQAMQEFGRLLGESKASLEGLQLASGAAREGAMVLQQAASELREVQANARALVEASGEQAHGMRSVLDDNRRILGEYERVFRSIDEGLAKAVKSLGDELIRFQEDATEQLRRQLGVFDEHLGSATGKLGSAVQDLGERLEDAAETIANSVERATMRRE
jgi:uncharacterized membrane protein